MYKPKLVLCNILYIFLGLCIFLILIKFAAACLLLLYLFSKLGLTLRQLRLHVPSSQCS
jgi:hypothetical protein